MEIVSSNIRRQAHQSMNLNLKAARATQSLKCLSDRLGKIQSSAHFTKTQHVERLYRASFYAPAQALPPVTDSAYTTKFCATRLTQQATGGRRVKRKVSCVVLKQGPGQYDRFVRGIKRAVTGKFKKLRREST